MSRTDTILYYGDLEAWHPAPVTLIGFYAVKRGKGRFENAVHVYQEGGSWFLYENGGLKYGPEEDFFFMMKCYQEIECPNDMGMLTGRPISLEQYKALAAARIRDALNGHEGKRDLMNVRPPNF